MVIGHVELELNASEPSLFTKSYQFINSPLFSAAANKHQHTCHRLRLVQWLHVPLVLPICLILPII